MEPTQNIGEYLETYRQARELIHAGHLKAGFKKLEGLNHDIIVLNQILHSASPHLDKKGIIKSGVGATYLTVSNLLVDYFLPLVTAKGFVKPALCMPDALVEVIKPREYLRLSTHQRNIADEYENQTADLVFHKLKIFSLNSTTEVAAIIILSSKVDQMRSKIRCDMNFYEGDPFDRNEFCKYQGDAFGLIFGVLHKPEPKVSALNIPWPKLKDMLNSSGDDFLPTHYSWSSVGTTFTNDKPMSQVSAHINPWKLQIKPTANEALDKDFPILKLGNALSMIKQGKMNQALDYLKQGFTQGLSDQQMQEVLEASKPHLPKKGTLRFSSTGLIYLKVDEIFTEFFKSLLKPRGFSKAPTYKLIGTHISVTALTENAAVFSEIIRKDMRLQEPWNFSFELVAFSIVEPKFWKGIKKAAIITVKSEELENLRLSHELPIKFKGHDFHITVGVTKE